MCRLEQGKQLQVDYFGSMESVVAVHCLPCKVQTVQISTRIIQVQAPSAGQQSSLILFCVIFYFFFLLPIFPRLLDYKQRDLLSFFSL